MKPPRPSWRRISPWIHFRPGGKGGSGGVREPRRPRPKGGGGAARLTPPGR